MTPLLTYIKPDNYDWELLKDIKKSDDADKGDSGAIEHDQHVLETETGHTSAEHDDAAQDQHLRKARNYALIASWVMTLAYLILWPIPMYGTNYVFSRGFFKGWIVVVFLWSFYAASTITLLPLWEGRTSIKEFMVFTWQTMSGKKKTTLLKGVGDGETTEEATMQETSAAKQEKEVQT